LSTPVDLESWTGEDVSLTDVGRALAQLRASSAEQGRPPNLRTSVMTHIAWVPPGWLDKARAALSGMGERHPSRTILLVPDPGAGENRIDASVSLECYVMPGIDRSVCSEVIELHLLGALAKAPASIVEPLLISDLPVFLRWRGEPPWGAQELEQLVDLTDRLIVDSTEWDDVPSTYRQLVQLFERTRASSSTAKRRRFPQAIRRSRATCCRRSSTASPATACMKRRCAGRSRSKETGAPARHTVG
jgi:hypothetical protein